MIVTRGGRHCQNVVPLDYIITIREKGVTCWRIEMATNYATRVNPRSDKLQADTITVYRYQNVLTDFGVRSNVECHM